MWEGRLFEKGLRMHPSPRRQAPAFGQCRTRSLPALTRIGSRGIFSRTARGLLMTGAILTLAASPRSTVAQQKAEAKPQPTQTRTDDPGKLKAQLTVLQQEVAQLKLKVATLELEKLGASVNVDKGKDGKEIATVNILKKWAGDKDAMQLLKNVPNLQVVYIDSNQVNDAALAPLKDLAGLSALRRPAGRDLPGIELPHLCDMIRACSHSCRCLYTGEENRHGRVHRVL